ncbi:MAG: WD40/YVTN/BNR-like repeat-containing protein [Aureliella sp.]
MERRMYLAMHASFFVLWWLVCRHDAVGQQPEVVQQPEVSQQPETPLLASFEQYQSHRERTKFGVDWVSVGPTVNSARVEAVQLDPTHPGTIYVAFGSGNLWKTTNNGMTWEPKFNQQASHGIGDFALAPSDPNIIYLGTGESLKKPRNFTIPGTGVYRSDDGGDTWRRLGLSDSWHIGEIVVHPTNPDIALVAVLGHFWSANKHRGLYRTEDGGETWQHVLSIDNQTGTNDVVWANDNPNIVYASTWQNFPDVAGKTSSVYRSDDAGVSWTQCASGLPAGNQIGRIGLAVSQSDSKKVYALVDNRGRIDEGAAQLFRSLDGGMTWAKTHEGELKIFSRIGWYFADLYVNPQDDEEVYALGVRIAHSADGGKTFELVGGEVAHMVPSAASGLHLDHCELWINPLNPQHLALGNDGGFYQSFDRGASWMHYNNLPTGEFYDVELDSQIPYRIYAGAQDDATVFGTGDELGTTRTKPWQYLWIDPWNGGDGCVTRVDPSDPNTVYFSAQEGAFRRKDMQTDSSTPIPARLPRDHDGDLQFNFVAPLMISPHDPSTLYLGGNYLFKSSNRGDDWSVVSADLTQSEARAESANAIATSALAESPRIRGLLYAGTDRGGFWVQNRQDSDWKDRSEPLPEAYIRSIVASRYADSRVYVAMSGLNYDDFGAYLFCSEDRGETWRSISANLPDEPVNVIVEDPVLQSVLYVGTFRGVYVSLDRGASWSLLGRSLPACSIGDLEIQAREMDLVVATHGRGIYKLNLRPIHAAARLIEESVAGCELLPIPTAKLPRRTDTRPGPNFRGVEKTTFSFYVSKDCELQLSFVDKDDKTVARFPILARAGLNQFRWDLVVESTDSPEPYFISYQKYLAPGQYRVSLRGEDFESDQQVFHVIAR